MKTTINKMIKELSELEPKNFMEYLLKGSALNQYLKLHKIGMIGKALTINHKRK